MESRRTGSVNSYSLASAGGVDIGEGSLAVARDSGEAEAAIGDGALINSPSASVQVNAVSEPRVSADAQGFAGAVLASVGVSYAEADASTTTRALVGSGATITAGSLAVNALAQANGSGPSAKSNAVGATIGGLIGAHATSSQASSKSVVSASIGVSDLTILGDVQVLASNATYQVANVSGVAGGLIGIGAHLANAGANSTTTSTIANGVTGDWRYTCC